MQITGSEQLDELALKIYNETIDLIPYLQYGDNDYSLIDVIY